jgi:hypothetical protein
MSHLAHRVMRCLGLGGLLATLVVVPVLSATASHATTIRTCSGTPTSPGVLTGTYSGNVLVNGVCAVNAGQAVVDGDLFVAPGGALVAAFALNDRTHSGFSSLKVKGNVLVGKGATAVLGCEALHFPCVDDAGKPPTLQSRTTIVGSLLASEPLGVIVHNSSIGGFVSEQGGGGGLSCTPVGIFRLFKSPVYSDYEDNVIGDSVSVAGVHSCWLGVLRNAVHGSLTFSANHMLAADANEVLANYVNRSLTCLDNVPTVQYGDSGAAPDVVGGAATGECSFHSLSHDPAPNGPLEPIAVPAAS